MKAFILLLLIISVNTYADVNMTFTGVLIEPPPCRINDDKDILVDFGRVKIKDIDSVNYQKDIDYTLICEPDSSDGNLTFTVSGTAFNSEPDLISTSVDNLAIKLLVDGNPGELNKPINIKMDSPPKLSLVLVTTDQAALIPGDFNASLTLTTAFP